MKSLDELFSTIMSIPHVAVDIKTRAGFLRNKLCGLGRGFDLFNIFGH
jgi:hypothetical protein